MRNTHLRTSTWLGIMWTFYTGTEKNRHLTKMDLNLPEYFIYLIIFSQIPFCAARLLQHLENVSTFFLFFCFAAETVKVSPWLSPCASHDSREALQECQNWLGKWTMQSSLHKTDKNIAIVPQIIRYERNCLKTKKWEGEEINIGKEKIYQNFNDGIK